MKKDGMKIVAVLLALLFTIAFAGCQGNATTTTSPGEPTAPSETTEVSAAPVEPVTISFWHNYDESAGQVAAMNELITEFEAANPGITVEPEYLEWQALKDNVIAGATTGTLPDVLRGDIGFVPQFQSLNVLFEMSSLPDYADVAATVLASCNDSAKMGDKYYGIALDTNTKILFYNKQLLDDAGVAVPTTQDELWAAARTLSKDGVVGFTEAWGGVWNVGQYIWSNGGDVLAPDYSTAQGYINGPIAVAQIQKLADLFADGAMTHSFFDPGALGDSDGWAAGKYAMEIDGPWRASISANATAAPLPGGSAGSIGVLGGEDMMMFNTSDAAHQDAAWKFIKFMIGKEAQVAMAKVGQMPVNTEALADPAAVEAMPLLPLFADALATAKARPVTPKWGDMENIIANYVNKAVTGVMPVQDAMDAAAAEIDALIAG